MPPGATLSPSPFPNLRNADLKSLLRRIGAQNSGTKPLLAARLDHELRVPRLPPPRASSSSRSRVLSLDLGIRNLAFCVSDVEVRPTRTSTTTRAGREGDDGQELQWHDAPRLTVSAWKRISLLDPVPGAAPAGRAHKSVHDAAQAEATNAQFTPMYLAKLAHDLVTRTLLPYHPDVLLLERQRFRSGGAPGVLEWTLRVNMLEQAVWACVEALRMGKGDVAGLEFVRSVSPASVAQMWMAEDDRVASKKKKKAVDLVRGWLAGPTTEDHGETRVNIGVEPIRLAFQGEGQTAREAFIAGTRGSRKGSATEEEEKQLSLTKRDDVADCLLQLVAWVRWERNRRDILAGMNAGPVK